MNSGFPQSDHIPTTPGHEDPEKRSRRARSQSLPPPLPHTLPRSEGRGSGGCEGLPGPSALGAPAPTARLEGILWLCGSGCPAGLEHEAARRRQYFVFFCGCGVGGSLASCWASWSGGRGEGKRAWRFSESQKVEVEVRLRHHLDQPLGGRHRLRRGQRFA